jgi:hypothetical protein
VACKCSTEKQQIDDNHRRSTPAHSKRRSATRTTSNSTLDLEAVLNTIVAKAVQLSNTDAGAIYDYNETTKEFGLRSTDGMDDGLIAAIKQLDSTGHEQLRVSRLAMDVVASKADFSKEPKFAEAVARKVYYGPVYFRRESEPYMTLALTGTRRDAEVSVAEVNLKLIWDVVSQIKVGNRGQAYVVDAQARLICSPGYQPGAAQYGSLPPGAGAGRARNRSRTGNRAAPGRRRHSRPPRAHRLCPCQPAWMARFRRAAGGRGLRPAVQSRITTPICLCDWRKEVLLIGVASRGVFSAVCGALS